MQLSSLTIWILAPLSLGDDCCRQACGLSSCFETALAASDGLCTSQNLASDVLNVNSLIRTTCFNSSCAVEPVEWNSCFPASATVVLEEGTVKKMEDLDIGDRVLVRNGDYSEVYFFSHRIGPSASFRFVELTTSETTLRVSANHLIFTDKGPVPAAFISPSDRILLAGGNFGKVERVSVESLPGLYNPHTLDGTIIVDGVAASCLTATIPSLLANSLLLPVRFAYRLSLPAIRVLDEGSPSALLRIVSALS